MPSPAERPGERTASWDDDMTPLPSGTREALARVEGRVKTGNMNTLDRVDVVRMELGSRIKGLDQKFDEAGRTLVEVMKRMMDLTASASESEAKLDILLSDRATDRQEFSTVRVETVRADLEVRKATVADVVDGRRSSRSLRNSLLVKLATLSLAVWSLISAMILAGKCG